MIEELGQIGFSQEEAKVYSAILTVGHASISDIVDKSGVSKKMSYKVLKRLSKEGYVIAEGGTKRIFRISEIELIGERLKNRVKTFEALVPELYAAANSRTSSRSVTTYGSPESIRGVFKYQMRRAKEKSDLLVIESTSFHFIEFMCAGNGGAAFDIYERTRVSKGIGVKLLFLDETAGFSGLDFETNYQRKNREIVRTTFSSIKNTLEGVYIWNDRVFLLDTREDKSILLVELYNRDIRQGFLSYFETLWNGGRAV